MSAPLRPSRDHGTSTRVQLLEAVRRGLRTVNALAAHLRVTDNAVRGHLAALERDRLVRPAGRVRSGVAGKPAVEYEATPAADIALSFAYAPALTALAETLAARLAPRDLRMAFRDAGRRLAPAGAQPSTLAASAEAAHRLLLELGGSVQVEIGRSQASIHGNGCPLAAAVARVPATCTMVASMLATTTGRRVAQRCVHGTHPRCAFRMT